MGITPDLDGADLYARLGVPPSATFDEIKRAYLTLVRSYTPERAPEAFKRIRESYETLGNPALRKQYDTRLDPRIALMLNEASAAMKAQDYPAAEQAYKRVLLESPDLIWVRNLLGLCFLYQQQPEKAIAQYERLVGDSAADASTHANAAHAYRMAKRFAEAEREFRTAMRLGGDQAMEYGLALIDMSVERGEPAIGDNIAMAELTGATPGSPAFAEYGTKRIELAIIMGKKARIPMAIADVVKALNSDEQRRYAAFALGKLASRLIAAEVFDPAATIAMAAKALQPNDPDYDGQEQVSRSLYLNEFDAVTRILNTHVSFAPNGWLHGLRPIIDRYCKTHAVFRGMRPITSAPELGRPFYGIGAAIFGHRDDDPQTTTFVVTHCFTFLFVPVFPLACYRVRSAPSGGWYFLGKVPYGPAQKLHWAIFVIGLLMWFALAVSEQSSVSASNSSSVPSASYVAPALTPPLVSNPDSEAEASITPIAVYEGEAENTTLKAAPIRARIRFTVQDWNSSPKGYFRVFPPLGGSGQFVLEARPDSVRIATISASGDTILWFARRDRGRLVGRYMIVGGRFSHQYGAWQMSRSSGGTIPQRVDPW